MTEVEVLVEVEGAVVVGDKVDATEVAAPATTGPPPWPSVGLDSAGARSHPNPTPTPTASSIAAISPATTVRRRPLPDPAGRPLEGPPAPAPRTGLWISDTPESARRLLSPSGGPATGPWG
ncbi:MAG TPA: hypothetical protein VF512_15325, partial [Actinomycetota bacterium]